MSEPLEQDEATTLEAELRRALQHQRAAYEKMQETQREVESLVRRARELLARARRRREALPSGSPVPRPPPPLRNAGEGDRRTGEP